MQYQPILSVAKKAALSSGKILLSYFGNATVTPKAYNNMLTSADLKSEKNIHAIIKKHFPDHAVLSEETASRINRNSDKLWIADPLDGTNNYAHGIPFSSVSIAYAEKGEVLAGVVYDPFRDELFWAVKGQGAFLNGKRMHVSKLATVKSAIITTGFFYNRGELVGKTLASIKKLFDKKITDIRRTGGAALDLCYTASGRFDAFFEYELGVWDYAAGMRIVREAGGICSDKAGDELDLHSKGLIVSNGHIHKDLLSVVTWKD